MSQLLHANLVLHQLAKALPQKHHSDIIIRGRLSAAISFTTKSD